MKANKLKIGDVLLYPKSGLWIEKIISLFTRSEFVHTAVYVGHNKIIQSNNKGVNLANLSLYTDRIIVLRHKTASELRLINVINFLTAKIGAKYDFLGLLGIALNFLHITKGNSLDDKNRFWCSELIADAYLFAEIKINADKKTFKVSPADLFKDNNFKVVGWQQ